MSDIREDIRKIMRPGNSHDVYCFCRRGYNLEFMIECDFCKEWYHGSCIDLDEEKASKIDQYCCSRCQCKNQKLKTTYKNRSSQENKNIDKKKKSAFRTNLRHTKYKNKALPTIYEKRKRQSKKRTEHLENSKQANDFTVDFHKKNFSDEDLARILRIDTSKRKAKMAARANISQCTETCKQPDQQCLGPECIQAARPDSKYCSDQCGVKLGTNRIVEILPSRLHQRSLLPCAADQQNAAKLCQIRCQMRDLESELARLDSATRDLETLVSQSRDVSRHRIVESELKDEYDHCLDCPLCGAEVAYGKVLRHMEACYRRNERRVMVTGKSPSSLDLLCNHPTEGGRTFCKRLRSLCPLHTKRHASATCRYPLANPDTSKQLTFCGLRRCPVHTPDWDVLLAANLDLRKLRAWSKLARAESEEQQIRRQMAERGNLLQLMTHQTTIH